MFTSIGYHTFVKFRSLTQEEANLLFEDFKKYAKNTKKICIIGPYKYEKDPDGRHFDIVYPRQDKGLWWKVRFSNKGFWVNGEFKTCSVKAIINPKVLTGEKNYIVAANAGYLNKVERVFNQEAEKISPMLSRFNRYSLNRIDYCINFDVSELKFDYPPSLAKEIPKLIMSLIKCGDIPDHFVEEYKERYQFYLKSGSVVVNCYWKYDDLSKNFPGCKDLEKSYDIIRFEVQFKYPKVFSTLARIRNERIHRNSVLMENIRVRGVGDFSETQSGMDDEAQKRFSETFMEIAQSDEVATMSEMVSDKNCRWTIQNYFNKVIKEGDYYTLDAAKRLIEARVPKRKKITRLKTALELVHGYGSIAEVKKSLQGGELEEFRRSLRDLDDIRINPVTIPEEWGIGHIPNLLHNYFTLCAEEQRKPQEKLQEEQILCNYIKDCRKQGIPCIVPAS